MIENSSLKNKSWHFSKRAKILVTAMLITSILVSVFMFLSAEVGSEPATKQNITKSTPSTPSSTITPIIEPQQTLEPSQSSSDLGVGQSQYVPAFGVNPPGLTDSTQTINSTFWQAVASNAWSYFQPGLGVDSNTGLPSAVMTFPYFTDWDLGVYVQSILDAVKIGLIGRNGLWGADARLDKVLSFLETRELNSSNGYPFWFYQAADGKDYHKLSDSANGVDIADTGRLMVALNNVITYNSSWATRIDNLVYNSFGNRSNYATLLPELLSSSTSSSIYDYFSLSGFACFWPNQLSTVPSSILNNIFSTKNVTVAGTSISVPEVALSCEPILCSIFELNSTDSRLISLAKQVYLAHEAYYNTTGQFIAFSEGNSPSGFIYEWVILPNGDSWKVTAAGDSSYSNYLPIDPVIYTKVAISFLSLYNTPFARNMVIFLEQNLDEPIGGYADGATNSGSFISFVGSNTNGMILNAALYALQTSN